MMRRAVLFAMCLLAFTVVPIRAADPPTPEEYRRALSDALALVERALATRAPAERAPLVAQARARLNALQTKPAPDNTGLLDELDVAVRNPDDTARLEKIQTRLRTLRETWNNPPRVASASDRAKLSDLLNRPPFTGEPTQNPVNQFGEALLEWVSELLWRLISGVFDARDAIVVVGLIIVIGALLYFLRNVWRNLTPEATMPNPAADDVPQSSADALMFAQRFANQGDYRSAIRQLYLATLLLLDERGVLRFDHALTNREYLRAVQNTPSLRAALQPVVEMFDRTWYGFEPVTRQDFEMYRQQVDVLRRIE